MKYYFENCFGVSNSYIDSSDVIFIVGEQDTGKTALLYGITILDFYGYIGDIYREIVTYEKYLYLNNREPIVFGKLYDDNQWILHYIECPYKNIRTLIYTNKTLTDLRYCLYGGIIRLYETKNIDLGGKNSIEYIKGLSYPKGTETFIKDLRIDKWAGSLLDISFCNDFYKLSGIDFSQDGYIQEAVESLCKYTTVALRNPEAYMSVRTQELFGQLIHKISDSASRRIVIETNSTIIIDGYGKRKGVILYCSKDKDPQVINILPDGTLEGSALIDWRKPYIDYALRQL